MKQSFAAKRRYGRALSAPRVRVAFAVAMALASAPRETWAARDVCEMLRDKGVLNDIEFNECKAAQEKEDAKSEGKAREVLGVQLPKWVSMITPFGDLRTRYEGFYENNLNARNRFRLRARLGLNVVPTDEIGATFRLATGNSDDPISTNQSFERTFTRKPVNFEQAYLTLKPGKTFGLAPGWGSIVGGKFGVNAYRVTELVFDDDLAPEGATETLNLIEQKEGFLRGLRMSTFQWVVDEIAGADDPWMFGGQIVADTAFGSVATWSMALADYHYESLDDVAAKYISPTKTDPKDPTKTISNPDRNSQLATSNAVVKDSLGNIIAYESGFNILNWNTELSFANPLGVGIPAGVFGDFAYNSQASRRDFGFALGVGIGKAGRGWYGNSLKNQGDWGASYTWERVEQDAVFAVFSFSDLDYVNRSATQKGSTNQMSHILRLDYMLLPNLQLTAKTLFINALDPGVSTVALTGNPTLLRSQVDVSFKF